MLQLQKTEVIRYNSDELTKAVTDSIFEQNVTSGAIKFELNFMALLLIIKRVVTLFIIEVNDFIKRHVSYLEANCEHKK